MYVSGTGGALREPVHGTWVAAKGLKCLSSIPFWTFKIIFCYSCSVKCMNTSWNSSSIDIFRYLSVIWLYEGIRVDQFDRKQTAHFLFKGFLEFFVGKFQQIWSIRNGRLEANSRKCILSILQFSNRASGFNLDSSALIGYMWRNPTKGTMFRQTHFFIKGKISKKFEFIDFFVFQIFIIYSHVPLLLFKYISAINSVSDQK